jgi:hypothetical protein
MRRFALTLVASLLVLAASCSDSSIRPHSFKAPAGARYQLTAAATLDAEITALIQALFPPELETNALGKWAGIKTSVAGGEIFGSRSRLLTLTDFVLSNQGRMDPPPNNESIPTATARLILYMSLYVYNGPNTPIPPQFGVGSDAKVEIVKPNAPATIQTPSLHAATSLDAGSVTTNTIIVVTQNTNVFLSHCDGPFTTKYCQYPIFYSYHSFPHVRFEKPVRVAMCPVPPGGNYGALPGIDDNAMVVAHDKPSNTADLTPGGFPVPGEAIEILPVNPGFNPTAPIITCAGTTYPQVTLFHVPRQPKGVFENALAMAARAGNSTARFIGRMLTPKDAYAIDNGEEHNTMLFSQFADMDTTGRPDLRVSQSAVSSRTVTAGDVVTLTYSLTNGGAAPSPGVVTTIRLTPTGSTPGGPLDLVPAVQGPSATGIFPLDARLETATVRIPDRLAAGTYTLGAIVSTIGGLPEKTTTLADNTQLRELTVLAHQ